MRFWYSCVQPNFQLDCSLLWNVNAKTKDLSAVSSGDSELLEAAYRECMQVLNSVGAKNFWSEHFQKMFLVYGAVYPLDLLALFSKRSCGIEKLFEADMCKNLEVKTFLVF